MFTHGLFNTAVGWSSMANVTRRDRNVAIGYSSVNTTTESKTTAVGTASTFYNLTGINNTTNRRVIINAKYCV